MEKKFPSTYAKGQLGREDLNREILERPMEKKFDSPDTFPDDDLNDPDVQSVIEYITSKDNITLQSHGLHLDAVKAWTIALSRGQIPTRNVSGEAKTYSSLLEWAKEVKEFLPLPNKEKNFRRKKLLNDSHST